MTSDPSVFEGVQTVFEGVQTTQSALSFTRAFSSPPKLNPILHQLAERLHRVKEEAAQQELSRQECLKRMAVAREDLKNTLDSCHKSMEFSTTCLSGFFRSISTQKLSREIAERFRHFDKNKNGTLEKEEVREGMAEMGQRPSEEELEDFFKACDTDSNGSIDLAEFEAMIRVKLGLENIADIASVVSSLRQRIKAAKKKSPPSSFPILGRRKSCPDVIFARKQLPPCKLQPATPAPEQAIPPRRGSLAVLDRLSVAAGSAQHKDKASAERLSTPARVKSPHFAAPSQRAPTPDRLTRKPSIAMQIPRSDIHSLRLGALPEESRFRQQKCSSEAAKVGIGWASKTVGKTPNRTSLTRPIPEIDVEG